MIFRLEGASEYRKGYVRVNESDRVKTSYQGSGVESRWYWGEYVNSNSTIFDNLNYRYKIIVDASGTGIYFNTERGTHVSIFCSELND